MGDTDIATVRNNVNNQVGSTRGRPLRCLARWCQPAAWALCVVGVAPARAPAQAPQPKRDPDAFLNRQRELAEEQQRAHDAQFGAAATSAFDFGGWYNFNLAVFDDGIESSRTLRRHDLRIWARASIADGADEFYVRGRLGLLDFNSGDSYDGNDNDVEGMNLERGIYRFDLARQLEAVGRAPVDGNVVVTAGRDLVEFGRGLALSIPLDHVAADVSCGPWELTALFGRTVGSLQDFDGSRTAQRMHRSFFGAQVDYTGWEQHRPFAYVLWQDDKNSEHAWRPFRHFYYDSVYVGLGAHGELSRKLYYATECVFESGDRAAQGIWAGSTSISAWAFDAELEYLFDGPRHGRVSVEYLFGSGDSDRTSSPTNTNGGRPWDGRDTGFVGFGYRPTGLSFAPRYSNLHLWRASASAHPWSEARRFRNLEVGAEWYLYHKHHRDGAVSDPTANRASGYLGTELDLFANWRVDASLAYTLRYGLFFPGSAFSDRSTRPFALVGIVWSF